MNILIRILFVAILLGSATHLHDAIASELPSSNVGFDVEQVSTASGPTTVAIWYPTSAAPRPSQIPGFGILNIAPEGVVTGNHLPLILISHGNGGSSLGHVDLAMALASAGFVVAAPTHPGDNYADASGQGSTALYSRRVEQLHATLDYMLGHWSSAPSIDQDRIGAYGMSAGAFTVLVLAGGTPKMEFVPNHCRTNPEFICRALAEVKSPLLDDAEGAGTFQADSRIKAISIAAPGLGFTFEGGGLRNVRIPVQVWVGDRDDTVPAATNASIIEQELDGRAEVHVVHGAAHLSFLAPCGEVKLPQICTDPEGFDRDAAHAAMNADILRFFQVQLDKSATR